MMGNGPESATAAKHLVVTGRVQGVWFRAWTQEQAQGLGVSGWVRNRSDGSVEAVVAGPHEAVQSLIEALQKGPRAAKVQDVRVTETEPPSETGFRIVG